MILPKVCWEGGALDETLPWSIHSLKQKNTLHYKSTVQSKLWYSSKQKNYTSSYATPTSTYLCMSKFSTAHILRQFKINDLFNRFIFGFQNRQAGQNISLNVAQTSVHCHNPTQVNGHVFYLVCRLYWDTGIYWDIKV